MECRAPPLQLPSAEKVGKGVLHKRCAKVTPFALDLEGAEEFHLLFILFFSVLPSLGSCRSCFRFQHWIRRSWKELPKQGRGGSCLPGDRGRAPAGKSQVWRPQAPPRCLICCSSGLDAWLVGTPNLLVTFLKWHAHWRLRTTLWGTFLPKTVQI